MIKSRSPSQTPVMKAPAKSPELTARSGLFSFGQNKKPRKNRVNQNMELDLKRPNRPHATSAVTQARFYPSFDQVTTEKSPVQHQVMLDSPKLVQRFDLPEPRSSLSEAVLNEISTGTSTSTTTGATSMSTTTSTTIKVNIISRSRETTTTKPVTIKSIKPTTNSTSTQTTTLTTTTSASTTTKTTTSTTTTTSATTTLTTTTTTPTATTTTSTTSSSKTTTSSSTVTSTTTTSTTSTTTTTRLTTTTLNEKQETTSSFLLIDDLSTTGEPRSALNQLEEKSGVISINEQANANPSEMIRTFLEPLTTPSFEFQFDLTTEATGLALADSVTSGKG